MKRRGVDDEVTMNTTEKLETMTIHLLLVNYVLPWCRYVDNAHHRRYSSRLVLALVTCHKTFRTLVRVWPNPN